MWWIDREGSPLTPHAFHPDLIDRYVASLQHLTNGSRGNVRTILSRVGAKALGPPLFPPPRVLSKRPKLMTPFNDDQVVELVSAVRGQTTAYRRDNFAALLAIFLGAGQRSEEGLRATGADVERDEYGVLLHITTGHHPRAIPVVRRWEAHIVAAAERVGERPLFLPNRRRLQRYDAPNFIKNLDLPPGLPHLTLRRLRCTWIVDHLLRGTPAHLLAEAAGMTTDQVGRYARHLPVPPPDQLRSILRGPKQ